MTPLLVVVRQLVRALEPTETFNADRVFKLLFLVDWRAAITSVNPVTGIRWALTGSDMVGQEAESDQDLVLRLHELDGRISNQDAVPFLDATIASGVGERLQTEQQAVVEFVIQAAAGRSWHELNEIVFSTRPLMTGSARGPLDLFAMASDYRHHSPVERVASTAQRSLNA